MTDSKPAPLKMNPPVPEPGPEDRLATLGIALPKPAAPVAAYVPTVEANGMLYVSGQVSFQNNQLMVGRLGDDRDLAYGVQAARACGLMVLAQIKAALGSLDRVERVVSGRGRGNRTPNLRFWRPTLCQLSYAPAAT